MPIPQLVGQRRLLREPNRLRWYDGMASHHRVEARSCAMTEPGRISTGTPTKSSRPRQPQAPDIDHRQETTLSMTGTDRNGILATWMDASAGAAEG
jgi:hypothetical protein